MRNVQNIEYNVGIQHKSVQTSRNMWKYSMINEYVAWDIGKYTEENLSKENPSQFIHVESVNII